MTVRQRQLRQFTIFTFWSQFFPVTYSVERESSEQNIQVFI